MGLDGNHSTGDPGHPEDHNLLEAALTAETTARTAGLTAEAAARTAGLTAETTARTAADAAEATARAAALTAETTARTAADAVEVAARTAALTRSALETALYPLAYSWELQPGSDVPATCVGVLPRIVAGWYGFDYYAGLVTVAAGAVTEVRSSPSDTTGWRLYTPDVAVTAESIDNVTSGQVPYPFSLQPVGAVPGLYLAVFFSDANGAPPYAFPAGWTPGNTTGSGPVLAFAGTIFGADIYAGLVDVAAGAIGRPSSPWLLYPLGTTLSDTPLGGGSVGSIDNGSIGYVVSAASSFMCVYAVAPGDPAPAALPAGWTFRPYGIGQIAKTDENAGGLIGDIVHVVSGYLLSNRIDTEVAKGTIPNWKGRFAAGSTHTVAVGDSYATPAFTISYLTATTAGTVIVGSDGSYTSGVPGTYGTAIAVDVNLYNHNEGYWPFIERYDLAAKKWLPRVPTPPVERLIYHPSVHWTSISEGSSSLLGSFSSAVDIWTMTAGLHALPQLPTLNGSLVALVVPYDSDGSYNYDIVFNHFDSAPTTGPSARVVASSVAAGVVVPANEQVLIVAQGDHTVAALDDYWTTHLRPLLLSAEIADATNSSEGFHEPAAAYYEHTGVYYPYAAEGGIAGVINGKLYFGGGDSDYGSGYEFFVYDPADHSVTRLPDCPGFESYPDYRPYGVVAGKLWCIVRDLATGASGHVISYDPATNQWTDSVFTGDPTTLSDQIHGFEIDGKLWFASYGAVFVFDPVALTVTAKAVSSAANGLPYLINGKIQTFGNSYPLPDLGHVYDPVADMWSARSDVVNAPVSNYSTEAVGVTHSGTPFLLSSLNAGGSVGAIRGVYGLTNVALDKPRAARLQDVSDHSPDTDWAVIALQGGFTEVSPARYRRRRGVVYIQGAVSGNRAQTPAFDLPEFFWPPEPLFIPLTAFDGSDNPEAARLLKDANAGRFYLHASGSGSTTYSLTCSFSV